MPARKRTQSERELYATCREAMRQHIHMLNSELARGKAIFRRGIARRNAKTRDRWAIVEKHIVHRFFDADHDSAKFRAFLVGIVRDVHAHERDLPTTEVSDEEWAPYRFNIPRSI